MVPGGNGGWGQCPGGEVGSGQKAALGVRSVLGRRLGRESEVSVGGERGQGGSLERSR